MCTALIPLPYRRKFVSYSYAYRQIEPAICGKSTSTVLPRNPDQLGLGPIQVNKNLGYKESSVKLDKKSFSYEK